MRRLTATVGVFLGAHLLLAFWSPFPAWGMDMLAYYPRWILLLFALLSGVLSIPVLRDAAIRLVQTTCDWLARRSLPGRVYLEFFLFVAAGLYLFVALCSATHLLGDGQLLVNELPLRVHFDSLRIDRAPLIFWLLKSLQETAQRFDQAADVTFRLYSYFSGFVYLVLAWFLSRSMGRTRLQRVLTAAFLLTPGYLQLFCGYVETYPLLLPGVLLYLWSGLAVQQQRLPLSGCAALLGILLACHFMLVSLVPSLCVLASLQIWRSRQRLKQAARTLLALVLAPALFVVCLLVLGLNPLTFISDQPQGHLLLLWGDLDPQIHAYHLLAPAHLLDLLNLQLLVAPAPLLALFILRWRNLRCSSEQAFLLSATLFMLSFTFVANARIGLFRDWDALSLAAIPLSLWIASVLSNQLENRCELRRAGFALCGAALLHTLLWLGINADTEMAAMRFSRLLDRAPLTSPARAYAWETLGTHYSEQSRYEISLESFSRAVEADPQNPRHWGNVGHQLLTLQRFSQAADAYEKAVAINPGLSPAWNDLGIIYFHSERLEASLEAFVRAVDIEPNNAEFLYNLCLAYNRLGRFKEAVPHCQLAARLKPDSEDACFQLLAAYLKSGDLEAARHQHAVLVRLDSALAGRVAASVPELFDRRD